MSRHTHNTRVVLSPPFAALSVAHRAFLEHAGRLAILVEQDADDAAMDCALEAARGAVPTEDRSTLLSAALSVLTDLARQRWLVRVTDAGEVGWPSDRQVIVFQPLREKARIRNQATREAERTTPRASNRKIHRECRKPKGTQLSVYSLMRDGRELAASLREMRGLPIDERRVALRSVIDPYLQFVECDVRCSNT